MKRCRHSDEIQAAYNVLNDPVVSELREHLELSSSELDCFFQIPGTRVPLVGQPTFSSGQCFPTGHLAAILANTRRPFRY